MIRRFCLSRGRSLPRVLAIAILAFTSTVSSQETAVSLEEELEATGIGTSLEPVPEEIGSRADARETSRDSTDTEATAVPLKSDAASVEAEAESDSGPPQERRPQVARALSVEDADGTTHGSSEEEPPLVQPFSFLSSVLSEFFAMDEVGTTRGQKDNFFISLGPRVGYDSNVLYAPENPISSYTSGFNGAANYDFGSTRWHVNSRLGGGVTYYDNRPSDPTDYNASLVLSAEYEVNRRLKLDFSTRTAYLAQPEPQLVGSVTRFSGDYWYTDTRLSAQYTLRPRLAVRAGYSLLGYQYTDEAVNRGLGFYSQTAHLALDYLLTPRTTGTVEYRYNPVTYYEADLGSEGHILTVGFLHTFSNRVNWSFQFGAEQRRLTNPAVDGPSEYLGPFLETSLSYEFAPRSSVFANLRYGTEPSGVSGVSIRETLRGSLGVEYAITGRLTGSLTFNYSHDAYDQPGVATDFTQEIYSGSLTLRYRLNRGLALLGTYSYIGLFSDLPLNSYERNLVNLGLDIIF